MGEDTDTWCEKEFEGHQSILTFPAEDWRDPWKWERVQESWEKSGKGPGTPENKEEGGKRREMGKRGKVTLGPDTTKDTTLSLGARRIEMQKTNLPPPGTYERSFPPSTGG